MDKERPVLIIVSHRKANWTVNILRRICLLHNVVKKKLVRNLVCEKIIQLMDDFKKKQDIGWALKEEANDQRIW